MSDLVLHFLLQDDAHHPGADLEDFACMVLPPGLAQATLAAVAQERARTVPIHPALIPKTPLSQAPSPSESANRRWRIPTFLVASLAAAAALLVVVGSQPEIGDPELLVPRGSESKAPVVYLEMSTQRGEALERFSPEQALTPGDRVFFRYKADQPAFIHLVHLTNGGIEVLHQDRVRPGQDDLRIAGDPLFWQVESGDSNGIFALVSSDQEIAPGDLAKELSQALLNTPSVGQGESARLCRAARQLGRYCDATNMKVSP
ncbi:MAG: hypothetical protein ACI9VR_004895 [Cognaticolwellia sp.]|jgi:hypothetical protein